MNWTTKWGSASLLGGTLAFQLTHDADAPCVRTAHRDCEVSEHRVVGEQFLLEDLRYEAPVLVQYKDGFSYSEGSLEKRPGAGLTVDGRLILEGRILSKRSRLTRDAYLAAIEQSRKACVARSADASACETDHREGRVLSGEGWELAEGLARQLENAELALLLKDPGFLPLILKTLRRHQTAGSFPGGDDPQTPAWLERRLRDLSAVGLDPERFKAAFRRSGLAMDGFSVVSRNEPHWTTLAAKLNLDIALARAGLHRDRATFDQALAGELFASASLFAVGNPLADAMAAVAQGLLAGDPRAAVLARRGLIEYESKTVAVDGVRVPGADFSARARAVFGDLAGGVSLPPIHVAPGDALDRTTEGLLMSGADAVSEGADYLWGLELVDRTAGRFRAEAAYAAVRESVARGMQVRACEENPACLKAVLRGPLVDAIQKEANPDWDGVAPTSLYAGYRLLTAFNEVGSRAVGDFLLHADLAHGFEQQVVPTAAVLGEVGRLTPAQYIAMARNLADRAKEDVAQLRAGPPRHGHSGEARAPRWPSEAMVRWGD